MSSFDHFGAEITDIASEQILSPRQKEYDSLDWISSPSPYGYDGACSLAGSERSPSLLSPLLSPLHSALPSQLSSPLLSPLLSPLSSPLASSLQKLFQKSSDGEYQTSQDHRPSFSTSLSFSPESFPGYDPSTMIFSPSIFSPSKVPPGSKVNSHTTYNNYSTLKTREKHTLVPNNLCSTYGLHPSQNPKLSNMNNLQFRSSSYFLSEDKPYEFSAQRTQNCSSTYFGNRNAIDTSADPLGVPITLAIPPHSAVLPPISKEEYDRDADYEGKLRSSNISRSSSFHTTEGRSIVTVTLSPSHLNNKSINKSNKPSNKSNNPNSKSSLSNVDMAMIESESGDRSESGDNGQRDRKEGADVSMTGIDSSQSTDTSVTFGQNISVNCMTGSLIRSSHLVRSMSSMSNSISDSMRSRSDSGHNSNHNDRQNDTYYLSSVEKRRVDDDDDNRSMNSMKSAHSVNSSKSTNSIHSTDNIHEMSSAGRSRSLSDELKAFTSPLGLRGIEAEHFSEEPAAVTPTQCKCKKSQCLKLYCDCFSVMQLCHEKCRCNECRNNSSFDGVRLEAIQATIQRTATAFKNKVTPTNPHVAGCRCSKSNCLKKYCECFLGSALCGANCRCVSCKNYLDSEELQIVKDAGKITALSRPPNMVKHLQEVARMLQTDPRNTAAFNPKNTGGFNYRAPSRSNSDSTLDGNMLRTADMPELSARESVKPGMIRQDRVERRLEQFENSKTQKNAIFRIAPMEICDPGLDSGMKIRDPSRMESDIRGTHPMGPNPGGLHPMSVLPSGPHPRAHSLRDPSLSDVPPKGPSPKGDPSSGPHPRGSSAIGPPPRGPSPFPPTPPSHPAPPAAHSSPTVQSSAPLPAQPSTFYHSSQSRSSSTSSNSSHTSHSSHSLHLDSNEEEREKHETKEMMLSDRRRDKTDPVPFECRYSRYSPEATVITKIMSDNHSNHSDTDAGGGIAAEYMAKDREIERYFQRKKKSEPGKDSGPEKESERGREGEMQSDRGTVTDIGAALPLESQGQEYYDCEGSERDERDSGRDDEQKDPRDSRESRLKMGKGLKMFTGSPLSLSLALSNPYPTDLHSLTNPVSTKSTSSIKHSKSASSIIPSGCSSGNPSPHTSAFFFSPLVSPVSVCAPMREAMRGETKEQTRGPTGHLKRQMSESMVEMMRDTMNDQAKGSTKGPLKRQMSESAVDAKKGPRRGSMVETMREQMGELSTVSADTLERLEGLSVCISTAKPPFHIDTTHRSQSLKMGEYELRRGTSISSSSSTSSLFSLCGSKRPSPRCKTPHNLDTSDTCDTLNTSVTSTDLSALPPAIFRDDEGCDRKVFVKMGSAKGGKGGREEMDGLFQHTTQNDVTYNMTHNMTHKMMRPTAYSVSESGQWCEPYSNQTIPYSDEQFDQYEEDECDMQSTQRRKLNETTIVYPFFGPSHTPKIVALRVLEWLDGRDLYSASCVSSLWCKTAMDDSMWE